MGHGYALLRRMGCDWNLLKNFFQPSRRDEILVENEHPQMHRPVGTECWWNSLKKPVFIHSVPTGRRFLWWLFSTNILSLRDAKSCLFFERHDFLYKKLEFFKKIYIRVHSFYSLTNNFQPRRTEPRKGAAINIENYDIKSCIVFSTV